MTSALRVLLLYRRQRSHGWAVLLLGVVLLTSGCVTLAPRPGGRNSEGPYARSTLRETRALAPSIEASSSLAPVEQEPSFFAGADFSTGDREALLDAFFSCTSPAEFIALQERVDMPRLVEGLTDWDAIRLGALGPVREDAAGILNRKRASFIVEATGDYGAAHAEVFVRFLVDSAFDDDLREVLFRLAQDKRLETTLGLMPQVRAELEARGLKLSARPDRDFEAGDLLRGAGSAMADMANSDQRKNALYTRYSAQRGQLPAPYQEVLDRVERAAAEQHFSPGHVVMGGFDHLTFGVPLGFYYLVAGTGHGLQSLWRGQYEQATRELTPFALLAALYAGGKGVRYLSEAEGAGAASSPRRFQTLESRVGAIAEAARQLKVRLGGRVENLRELGRAIQASREAGRFVAVGGADAALALYEARGDVARARPLLVKGRSGATSSSPMNSGASLAALVDEGAGHTLEVVEAKLAVAELESTGPRLPRDVGRLEKARPSLDAPPPEARGNPRWSEYVDYYEKRLSEVKEGEATKGPLSWEAYEQLRGWFARGLAFERTMVKLLREDARLPRAQRRFLGDFDKPRIETNVGVSKPGTGLRYADVLVIEEGEPGGRPRRVETFSFKSRDLSGLSPEALSAQMVEDASEALRYYGERLDIRRGSLQSLLPDGREVQVPRVRLIYEGGPLKPKDVDVLKTAEKETRKDVPAVEVSFQ